MNNSAWLFVLLLLLLFLTGGGAVQPHPDQIVSEPLLSETSSEGYIKDLDSAHVEKNSSDLPDDNEHKKGSVNRILPGGIIFLGEQDLDITAAVGDTEMIAWWKQDEILPVENNPDIILPVSSPQAFYVDPEIFADKTGRWYQWDGTTAGNLTFSASDPSIELSIWDGETGAEITDETIHGQIVNFLIRSNLESIMTRSEYQPVESRIYLFVSGPDETIYKFLIGERSTEHSLRDLQINGKNWYWTGDGDDHTSLSSRDGWNTSAQYLFNGENIYPAGNYTIRAECNANDMKDNYRASDGSDYTGKTVSKTITITLPVDARVSLTVDTLEKIHPGDCIRLSGINTASDVTYLFISGKNLPPEGGTLTSPKIPVISDNTSGFDMAEVSDDGSWEYSWNIPDIGWQESDYILYASESPKNKTKINETRYDSSIITIFPSESAIHLISGWNFISHPLNLVSGYDTMAVFSGVNTSGHSIFGYDGQNNTWVRMNESDPFPPLTGLWVYSAEVSEVTLMIDRTTLVPPKTLHEGWNAIGITIPERTTDQALASVSSSWIFLVGFNGSIQQYTIPIIKGELSVNTTKLENYDGFWIYMTDNQTFTG